jgi:predicted naringenin-chalcone synthase
MAAFARHAPPLALAAVRAALADAAMAASRITHLITVSCTGFQAPGVDLELISQLGLDAGVQRTHVGFMGCHGALNGLRVAQAFVEADAEAVVLLCCVELCSLHLYYGWDPEKVVANALFADGAAALLATARPAHPEPGLHLLATGSTVIPDTADLMHWQIGDQGFEMGLSPRVPEAVAGQLRPWLERWLQPRGHRLADIASWAMHPGGPRILQVCGAALGLDPHQLAVSQAVLQEHGNMSSATVLFILDRLRRTAAPGPCLALAFGPGLCAEVALLNDGT